MLLRLIRGNVAAGREADFVDVCRRQAIGRARAPGLVGLLRRVPARRTGTTGLSWQPSGIPKLTP